MGKSLTINDIKEILRIEVRKQIKHTQHFYLGTNVFDKEQTKQSLDVVSSRETKMKEDLSGENIKEYERELDKKLEGFGENRENGGRRLLGVSHHCFSPLELYFTRKGSFCP